MTSRGASAGYDRLITVFSPEGRLHQIEYAFKAIRGSGMTSLGLRGKDSVVIVTQKKVPDKLVDPTSVTHMFEITKRIGCCCTGLLGDSRMLVVRARQTAAQFAYENGYPIQTSYLAQKMADNAQIWTQHAFMRAFGVASMFIGMDDEKGPQLYRIDPAGLYMGFKGCAAGKKEQEGNNFLEHKLKKNPDMNRQDTIETCILGLLTVLGMELKPSELEVGVVDAEHPRFRTLTEAEIEQHLINISERA